MKRLLVLALPFLTLLAARADILGRVVEITPASGWVSVDPREPGQSRLPAPTLKFVPKGGRLDALMVSLLPAKGPGGRVSDLASLKQFNLMSAQAYLPSPEAKPPVTELKIANGLGVYISCEDPSLAGKPTPPDEYRIATTASILLGDKFVLHCTIFHETMDSAEFRQALQMLSSAALHPVDSNVVSVPGLGAVLHLPPGRFQPSELNFNSDPGYFTFNDNRGVMLSGWLDRAARFKDMPGFWASEKANLVKKGGLAITDESTKTINGWSAVLYTVKAGEIIQKNIRACRVVGDTWADVHLSMTGPAASWPELEAVVTALTLTTP